MLASYQMGFSRRLIAIPGILFVALVTCMSLPLSAEINKSEEITQHFLVPEPDVQRILKLVRAKHYLTSIDQTVEKNLRQIDSVNQYLAHLDPYSKYLSQEQATFFRKRGQKLRIGIGLNLLNDHGRILGVPLKNGPFYRSGYKQAEFVYSINGRIIDFEKYASYSFLGQLEISNRVNIVLAKEDGSAGRTFSVVIEKIKNPSILVYHHKDALIVQINKFKNGDVAPIKSALAKVDKRGKIIFDLRFSPGGDIYAMADLLSLFLVEGAPVAALVDNRGDRTELHALDGRIVQENPIYLLASEYTASSAELFIRALRERYPLVSLVGMPTKGKCLAQENFELPSGGLLNLSTHRVSDAQGVFCQGKPIHPDRWIPDIARLKMSDIYRIIHGINQQ